MSLQLPPLDLIEGTARRAPAGPLLRVPSAARPLALVPRHVPVTVLFSDIVGFTDLVSRLGDADAYRAVSEHNRIVRNALARHGGRELELRGDGFLLAFSRPGPALRTAVAIQRALGVRSAAEPDATLELRMGLHSGEAIEDGDALFGLALILGARIADRAEPGEILVSQDTARLLADDAAFVAGPERRLRLKGFARPVRLRPALW